MSDLVLRGRRKEELAAPLEELRGSVSFVVWSKEGFTVGKVRTADGTKVFAGKCVVQVGDPVIFKGTWQTHEKFGEQFAVKRAEFDGEVGEEGLARFLAGHPGARGIGKVKAEKIAEAFKGRFDRAIEEEPEEVARIAGVDVEALIPLREAWISGRDEVRCRLFLASLDLTPETASRIMETYKRKGLSGMSIKTLLEADPFALSRDVSGFGFTRADEVARKVGLDPEHPTRIAAGIEHAVRSQLDDGHTWTSYPDLAAGANRLLNLDPEKVWTVLDAMPGPNASAPQASEALKSLATTDSKMALLWESWQRHPVLTGRTIDSFGTMGLARPDVYEKELAIGRRFYELGRNSFFSDTEAERIARESEGEGLNLGQRRALWAALRHNLVCISGAAGCHGRGTKILMADGSISPVEAIQVSSRVMGWDGTPRRVLSLGHGRDRMYRVVPNKGAPFVVNEGHILTLVQSSSAREGRKPTEGVIDVSVRDWLKWNATRKNEFKLFRSGELDFNQSHPCGIDPYFLGVLLGDGCLTVGVGVTSIDAEIVALVYEEAAKRGLSVRPQGTGSSITYFLTTGTKKGQIRSGRNILKQELRELGLYGCTSHTKFIPDRYLRGPVEVRKQLLAGLIDTDGHLSSPSDKCFDLVSASERLAQEVAFIARSLGLAAYVKQTIKSCQTGATGTYYRVAISGHVDCIPVRLPRKRAEKRLQKKNVLRTGFYLEYLGEDEYFGFTIEGDGRYLLADFTVTHNTGKTFVLKKICDAYENAGAGVLLLAPTGKASKRMEAATGRQASTIHLALGYKGKRFHRDTEWFGPGGKLHAGLVVVDETSMADVLLFWELLDCVDLARTTLVLVGDHHQLPPVGPGSVLRDIVERRPVPVMILDEVVRQAGALREASSALLKGEVKGSVWETLGEGKLFAPWVVKDGFEKAADVGKYCLELAREILPDKLGFDRVEIQFLAPMYKGPCGVDRINRDLQRLYQKKFWNVEVETPEEGKRPKFYVHDRVIQTRNNYELGVMNGTQGMVRALLPEGRMEVEFDGGHTVSLSREDVWNVELAYCLSVHKSQGDQWPAVVTVVHSAHSHMLERNLFYTGVTRASKTAIVVGDAKGIRGAAQKTNALKRRTWLSVLELPRCG